MLWSGRFETSCLWAVGVLLVGGFVIPSGFCVPVEEDLSLSGEEKVGLEKFKDVMDGRLPQDFMKKEIFLIKWLRRAKLDVKKATRLLLEHLEWRRANKWDGVLDEDFSSLNDEFPIDLESTDYEGRPVIIANGGDWDVRQAIVTGNADLVFRHAMRSVEVTCDKIRRKQALKEPVTQMQIIFDLKGFNLVQHGCIRCLTLYLNFVLTFQKEYPGMADNIIFVNAPSVFEVVLDVLRPYTAEDVHDAFKIFGSNRDQWQRLLFTILSPDQLPPTLGGTKKTVD